MNTLNPTDKRAKLRAANVRTALVLLSIALLFFAGVIATRYVGGQDAGLAILGTGVLVFLSVAIGRNLRKGR